MRLLILPALALGVMLLLGVGETLVKLVMLFVAMPVGTLLPTYLMRYRPGGDGELTAEPLRPASPASSAFSQSPSGRRYWNTCIEWPEYNNPNCFSQGGRTECFLLSQLKKPFILDGATGTELQKLGMPQGVLPARWILDHPEAIRTVQRSYAEAGSMAVYAPTFCTTRADLKKYGEDISVRDINRQLVELSREAAPGLLVGGDIAPAGLPLPPMGETSFDELLDVYAEQAAALEEAGVDFFAVETQMSLVEARAALRRHPLGVGKARDRQLFLRQFGGARSTAAI